MWMREGGERGRCVCVRVRTRSWLGKRGERWHGEQMGQAVEKAVPSDKGKGRLRCCLNSFSSRQRGCAAPSLHSRAIAWSLPEKEKERKRRDRSRQMLSGDS